MEREVTCQNHVMDQKPNFIRTVPVCLRGSRTLRKYQRDIKNADTDIQTADGAI